MLQLLYETVATIELKKCDVFAKKLDYLIHVIWFRRCEVFKNTSDSVPKIKHPTLQTELRSSQDLCNTFTWFVQKFARLVANLTQNVNNRLTGTIWPP